MVKRITTTTTTEVKATKVVVPKKPRTAKVVPDTVSIDLLQQANIELQLWNSKLQKDLEVATSMNHKLSKMNTILFLCNVVLSTSFIYFY